MGERRQFSEQAKRTACGRLARAGCGGKALPASPSDTCSALPMQRRNEGENPSGRIEIAVDLALQTFQEKLRSLVVNGTAAHIDRLDLRPRRGADGRIIALADKKIVFEQTAKRRQRENMRAERVTLFGADFEGELCIVQRDFEHIGTRIETRQPE